MKNSTYIIILLSLGILFVSYKWATVSDSSEPAVSEAGSDAYQTIMTRTSVRSYSDREISGNQVDSLLKAAMAAPTAGNKQPWRFVVIKDKKILSYIAENNKSMTMMENAPLAIVVCGDTTASFPGQGREYWVQDASAATENLLLAAHDMGLGAVWCGVYPIDDRVREFSALLNLPPEILPLNCIAVGYPNAPSSPKDKWKPEYVRYNRWNEK